MENMLVARQVLMMVCFEAKKWVLLKECVLDVLEGRRTEPLMVSKTEMKKGSVKELMLVASMVENLGVLLDLLLAGCLACKLD